MIGGLGSLCGLVARAMAGAVLMKFVWLSYRPSPFWSSRKALLVTLQS
jgi:hypothetical protein